MTRASTAIRRAFQKLARRFEPDASRGRRIAELQAAYETLSDADRRRRYDDELGGVGPAAAPLDWSFTRRPAAGDLRRPLAPTSLAAEIVLRPDEAAAGTVLSLDVPVTGSCDACGGTGGSLFDCERCGGEGRCCAGCPSRFTFPRGCARAPSSRSTPTSPAVPTILLTVHLRRI